MKTFRIAPIFVSVVLLPVLLNACTRMSETPEYQAVCHGPPLAGLEGRVDAETEGYQVDEKYNCITKQSYAEHERARQAYEAR